MRKGQILINPTLKFESSDNIFWFPVKFSNKREENFIEVICEIKFDPEAEVIACQGPTKIINDKSWLDKIVYLILEGDEEEYD